MFPDHARDCLDDPIHGDRFAEIADYSLNDRGVKQQKGKIYFFKTDYLNQYKPDHPHVLITHNSDLVPPSFGEHVKAHFGQNVHTECRSIPIPIGLERPGIAGSGNIEDFRHNMSGHVVRDNWLYVNFSGGTNATRPAIQNHFAEQSWATIQARVPFREYLHQLRRHIFVMSPPGNGPDCHRTWEALYSGSIPVCFANYHNREFAKILPIVLYQSTEQLTLEYLQSEFNRITERIRNNCYNFHALKSGFWRELIEHYARVLIGNG